MGGSWVTARYVPATHPHERMSRVIWAGERYSLPAATGCGPSGGISGSDKGESPLSSG